MSAAAPPAAMAADALPSAGARRRVTPRDLLLAAGKTGSGSAASLVLGAATMKILAVVLGPAGVGIFSLLRQSHLSAVTLATLNGQTALVQGIASKDADAREHYVSTVALVFGTAALSVAGGLVAFAPWIARFALGSDDPAMVLAARWLALPAVLMSAYLYLAGVLNGYRAIGRMALVQVANVATMALLAYPLARLAGTERPVVLVWLLAASSGAGCLAALAFTAQGGWLPRLRARAGALLDGDAARHFFRIAGTMLVAGAAVTGSHLAIRVVVTRTFGFQGAGIFDAAWTIGMLYVALVLTSFQTFYLPELSRTSEPAERTDLVRQVLRITTLVVVPLLVGLIVAAPLVVRLLYSGEFAAATGMMRWMLLGDYFKVAGWVLAIPLLAYAEMRVFLWTELVWHALLLGASWLAVARFGSLAGIGIAFTALYLGYLVFMLAYARRRFGITVTRRHVLTWLAGLLVVAGAFAHTGGGLETDWVALALWPVAALLFCAAALTADDRRGLLRLARGPRG